MEKKTIKLLTVLVLSIAVNINYVKAVTINGEDWNEQNKCVYKSDKSTITLYYNGNKTVLNNSKDGGNFTSSGKTELTYKGLYNYKIKNEVSTNSSCPDFVYEYHGKELFGSTVTSIYTAKKRSGIHEFFDFKNTYIYVLNTKIEEIPDMDNTGGEECDGVISSEAKKLIDKYLGYIHILVPIMVMTLGIFDFLKAMTASKEDEMKKAQKRFIIRLVAGVLVFLAPTIVNLIINILNNGACPIN